MLADRFLFGQLLLLILRSTFLDLMTSLSALPTSAWTLRVVRLG